MKIAFFTEGQWQGNIDRDHPNMRTEMAWMCATKADHYNINDIPAKQYDLGIVIKLGDEIEGLIPMNKVSKDQKKNMVSNLNEGDSLDLLVVEVKSEEKYITLMLDDSNVDD